MDERFAVVGVASRTPLAEAAPAILDAKADPLFALEEAASGGADMDAVHDMRVASRRLREAMRLLAPVYPPREFGAWYRRVRRITRALGPVRDSDVFIDAFARLGKGLGDGGKRAVAFLVGLRMGTRERELDELNRVLAKLDLAENRRSFARLAEFPRRTVEVGRPLADFAHAAVAERTGVVFGLLPLALEEANIDHQHELRIAFKRLRYAVEVFAPCYGDEFDALHKTLTAFQDTLGDMHDVHVFLDRVREPALAEAAARAGVSAGDLGEVAELLDQRAHREFVRFTKLAAENPAGDLLPSLLLPLSRLPELEEAAEEADEAVAEAAEELVVTEAPPASAEAEAPIAAEIAEITPPAGPSPEFLSAVDGFEMPMATPVVVGAQPWARAEDSEPVQVVPVAAAPDGAEPAE